jgi:hypothetical protein
MAFTTDQGIGFATLTTRHSTVWATETIGSSFLPYYDFTSSGPLTWMVEARCKRRHGLVLAA